jgi:hypothetical protein
VTNFNEVNRFLASAIESSIVGREIVDALLPGGLPLDVEGQFWDYKEHLPTIASNSTELEKTAFKAEMAELVKDAASFYNACGGYILFGVRDKGTSRLLGCAGDLDCGDFNRRIEGALGTNVECLICYVDNVGTRNVRIAVLLVPRRRDHLQPVSFRKAAPAHASGKKAYNANDTYVRIRDESRPASNSSADWRFLYGSRQAEGLELSVRPYSTAPIRAVIPARDPDLTKFIGRESYLSRLRQWLVDKRSPVRLLTGIGGLGKTSIAYRFAEEVIDTRAGEVEHLLWLTAKARTFSALSGSMVEASRVDFSDSTSLYKVLLGYLGSSPDWGEDEPTGGDLIESIVEALSIYTCLIIIDDVDSLAVEDQREVVHTLSNAISRTVSSDRMPSRILFTSRIDQGVAPGVVIKVDGFPREEFNPYVEEVAATLGISLEAGFFKLPFYEATSGSPLFVASILRLVRLGTPLLEAIARWKGEEGVEVRRFAFERELQRLPMAAARLLYAACLLGETTTLELSDVLEVTPRVIANNIADLQSFHLILTQTSSRLGASISAPDDVSLTRDVLKTHLASSADTVEAACALARKTSEINSKGIAQKIANIVSLWRVDAHQEALIAAKALTKDFPTNGDVLCLYATALTKGTSARWSEADVQFSLASKLGCNRPELTEGWLATKRQIQDWSGLLSLSRSIVSTGPQNTSVLLAFVLATEELIKIARARGDRARRIELSSDAIQQMSTRMERQRLSAADADSLWRKKLNFARVFMEDTVAGNKSSGDKIRIFDALVYLVDQGVFITEFVARGVLSLEEWWADVERRPYIDEVARRILIKSLGRTEHIERVLLREGKSDVSSQVQHKRLELAHRAARLS